MSDSKDSNITYVMENERETIGVNIDDTPENIVNNILKAYSKFKSEGSSIVVDYHVLNILHSHILLLRNEVEMLKSSIKAKEELERDRVAKLNTSQSIGDDELKYTSVESDVNTFPDMDIASYNPLAPTFSRVTDADFVETKNTSFVETKNTSKKTKKTK